MRLEQSFEVAAPLEHVWRALIDIEFVAPCLPGAAIKGRNEAGDYEGEFVVKLGPTTAAYRGTLTLQEVDAKAHRATLHARGADKRGRGSADALIVNILTELDASRTRVDALTELTITGRLASFGRGGMIEDISNRLLGQFADCLQAKVVEAGAGGAAVAASQAAEPEAAAVEPEAQAESEPEPAAVEPGAQAESEAEPEVTEPAPEEAASKAGVEAADAAPGEISWFTPVKPTPVAGEAGPEVASEAEPEPAAPEPEPELAEPEAGAAEPELPEPESVAAEREPLPEPEPEAVAVEPEPLPEPEAAEPEPEPAAQVPEPEPVPRTGSIPPPGWPESQFPSGAGRPATPTPASTSTSPQAAPPINGFSLFFSVLWERIRRRFRGGRKAR